MPKPPRSPLSVYDVAVVAIWGAILLRFTVWVRVELPTGPPPKNCAPPASDPALLAGNPRSAGSVGYRDLEYHTCISRGVPYRMTVGVPVTAQPGMVTEP